MSQWKSKVSMPTQIGKACLADKNSIGTQLAFIGVEGFIDLKDPSGENGGYYDNLGPFAPASVYDNLVGAIWLPEPKGINGGTYDTAPTGEIEVREPRGEDAQNQPQGGHYDNR